MKMKQYETPNIQFVLFYKDILTFSAEPEDEKTQGDIFWD